MSVGGLDLGTSKIAACFNINGRPQQVYIDNLDKDYPCSLFYKNKIEYGRKAQTKGLKEPQFYFRNIKGLLGRKYSDPFVQHMKTVEQFGIVEGPGDSILLEVMENSNIVHKTPFELMSLIITDTLNKIKDKLDAPIEGLAIAFPPSFNDIQKRELKKIIINTGIRHIETIPETTAACYHFGYKRMAAGHVVLIVDCGAGTIDASLVEYKDGELTILSHTGSSTIGGNLYTDKVSSYVYNELIKRKFDYTKLKQRDHIKIQTECERCKIMLTNNASVEVSPDIEDFPTIHITQYGLQLFCRDTNKEVVKMVKELIDKAEVHPSHLILSGKGMNLRCLAEEICKLVENSVHYMNIEEPVAYGLAMYMASLMEKHHKDDTCNRLDTYTTVCNERTMEKGPGSQEKGFASMHPSVEKAFPAWDDLIPAFPSLHNSIPEGDREDSQRDEFAFPAPLPLNPYIQSRTYVENFTRDIPVNDISETLDEPQVDRHWFDSVKVLDSDESVSSNMFVLNVNEKRSMDIRIGRKKHFNQKADTEVLVSRDQQLPRQAMHHHIKKEFNFGPGELQYNLFEGNSPVKKDCRRIRHTILKRDAEHPPTQFWPVVLDLDIDKDGFFVMSYKWKDTGKEIEVVKDEEVDIHSMEYEPLPDVPSSPVRKTRQLEVEEEW